MERLPSSPNHNSPLILNGVLSLANAGTWLQMLRSKLSPQTSHRRRTQTADVQDIKDGAASDCMAFDQDEAEDFTYSLPIRRSRSDALYDRQINSTVSRRGAELPRTSSVGKYIKNFVCSEGTDAAEPEEEIFLQFLARKLIPALHGNNAAAVCL